MCLCVVYPSVSSLRWFVVLISFSTSLFRVFFAAHDGERLKRCILCAWYIMNRNINIHLAPSIAAALAATAVRICGLEPEPCVCDANANIQQVYQNSFCTLPISISSNMIYSVIAAHRCCCHWYGGNCTAAKLFIMSPQPQCHHSHCTRVCVLSVCCVSFTGCGWPRKTSLALYSTMLEKMMGENARRSLGLCFRLALTECMVFMCEHQCFGRGQPAYRRLCDRAHCHPLPNQQSHFVRSKW